MADKKWDVGQNDQDNNFDFNKLFLATWQCFSTCSWMLMSWICPEIKYDDDKGLAKYLDDVEINVGSPGIGEEIARKLGIKAGSSYYFAVQQAGIQKWMNDRDCKGKVVFSEKKIKFYDLPDMLDKSPVILNTSGLGGTRGHIILAIGYTDDNIIVNDPFGDARDSYTDKYGEGLFYEKEWLKRYCGENIICLYWEGGA